MAAQPFDEGDVNAEAREDLYLFVLGGLAFAKQVGRDPGEWISFMARAGVATIPPDTIQSALETARNAARSVLACNGRFVSLIGDERHAEVVMADAEGLPMLCQALSLSREEADRTHNIFKPLAEALHLSFEWRREGDQVRYTFEKLS